jgi:hypothetical protein
MAWHGTYIILIIRHSDVILCPFERPKGRGGASNHRERQKGKEGGGDQWSVRTCVEDARAVVPLDEEQHGPRAVVGVQARDQRPADPPRLVHGQRAEILQRIG